VRKRKGERAARPRAKAVISLSSPPPSHTHISLADGRCVAGRVCVQGGRRPGGAGLCATARVVAARRTASRWRPLQGVGGTASTTSTTAAATAPSAQGHDPGLAPGGGLAVQAGLGRGRVHPGMKGRSVFFNASAVFDGRAQARDGAGWGGAVHRVCR